MQDFKTLETAVLITMVNAHSSYYGRKLTEEELSDCKFTINELQGEIESRKKRIAGITAAKPVLSLPTPMYNRLLH